MRRRVDLVLLGTALAASFATGVLGLWVSEHHAGLVVWAHGAAGMAVIALVWSKLGVIRRGLRRRWPGVGGSLAGALCAVGLLGFGVAHSAGVGDVGPLTALGWHIAFALVLAPLVVLHLATRPVLPRRGDLTRAAFLRLAAFTAAGVAAKLAFDRTLGARRAATGSVEQARPSPTVWIDDPTPRLDAAAWRLDVGGRRLGLADLARLPQHEWTCTLDCTSGWYARNRWRGVLVSDLPLALPAGTGSIEVRSATGYARRFDLASVPGMMLATHLDGVPLDPGNGAPVRLVAAGRRGFWWVKWVTSVRPSSKPAWWQLPFPL
ncbi:MAG TPA: molybdopterin-dependent oxidoreductase [Gaiellales bacterium]|nr:molybdopterin-dependent oxidoreductase [Gaiellales bacterium]